MKYLFFLFILLLSACSNTKSDRSIAAAASSSEPLRKDDAKVIGDQPEPDTLKGSLRAKEEGTIGPASISIRYHSPAVRGRIVWGGLVPFDQVWVTGAHMATSIEINKPFRVEGTTIPAGKYAFFTTPGKEKWTLIINRNWEQHLADDYDPKLDVVRMTAVPVLHRTNQERLRYTIQSENEKNGWLSMRWEKLEVKLPIEVLP